MRYRVVYLLGVPEVCTRWRILLFLVPVLAKSRGFGILKLEVCNLKIPRDFQIPGLELWFSPPPDFKPGLEICWYHSWHSHSDCETDADKGESQTRRCR
jgi:hypothetical protein